MENNYNILTRSAYTFFQSLLKITDIVDFSQRKKYDRAFLIDKNVMFGAFSFYNECILKGIKPIIGLEIEYENIYELVFAKNYDGYIELIKISSFIQSKGDVSKIHSKLNSNNLIILDKNINFKFVSVIDEDSIETLNIYNRTQNQIKLVDDEINYLDEYKIEKEYIDKLCDKINIKIDKKEISLPISDLHKDFKEILIKKLESYILQNPKLDIKKYTNRLMYEIDVIEKNNFVDYFFLLSDIVNYAKKNSILVGPGRGSSSGSLVVFLMNITEIDPIKNNLFFERFLNLERMSLPDIDIDIEDNKREKIIKYVFDKYGKDYVSQIITFQKLRGKMSLKDIGRSLKIPIKEITTIANSIDQTLSLIDNYKNNKTFSNLINKSDLNKKLYEHSKLIEGLPRQYSVHAAGIIVSSKRIDDCVPTLLLPNGLTLTQYSMSYLEYNGLIKLDLLGLRNLSFESEILHLVKSNKKIDLEINDIPLNDQKVFRLLSHGKTAGIFQLESPGMTNCIKKVKPNSIDELANVISLFRPGPSTNIPTYVKNKKNSNLIIPIDKSIDDIVKSTNGIIIYQEQIMEISKIFSGFSLSRADILRKAISKKNTLLMKSLKEEFIKGAIQLKRNSTNIENVYSLIMKFANYGFNKSHAYAYALITYQLAYLKYYFPKEFYLSLLNSIIGNEIKIIRYITEMRELKLNIFLPNINLSLLKNSLDNNNDIVLGLLNIKGMGAKTIENILKERDVNGNFKSLIDFIVRTHSIKVTSSNIKSLIECGAFDEIDLNRNTLLMNFEKIKLYSDEYADIISKKEPINDSILRQIDKNLPKPLLENIEKQNYLNFENNSLGFSLTKKINKNIYDNFKNVSLINEIDLDKKNTYFNIIGLLSKVKETTTKTNMKMGFSSLSDDTGTIELIFWPNKYLKFNFTEFENKIVKIKCTTSSRGNSLVVEEMEVVLNE